MACAYTTPAGLCDGKAALSANEHYLPRALGNFKNNEPLVNRICNSCQELCSQLEDVFAHNSAEAFFREMIGRGEKELQGKEYFLRADVWHSTLGSLGTKSRPRLRDSLGVGARYG